MNIETLKLLAWIALAMVPSAAIAHLIDVYVNVK